MPEVIFPPKEFDPTEFGLPEDARGLSPVLDLGRIESQCGGVNESQNVETYDGTLGVSVEFVRHHQRAVGQTMRGTTRSCSGTLIGHDLFLSAGHCFDAHPSPQTQVTFNFQTDAAGNPLPEQRFPILGVLEHRLGGLDYEIIRLDGNPAGAFGFTLVSPVDAAVGDMVCLIGHPATAPKQIEAGPVTALDGDQIRYNDADTLPGNSGSGILHVPTGRLVGVHTNGGCAGTTPETGFNLGIRISSLIAASPILQGLVNTRAGIFAAIWEQDGGPAFVARHGLTAADYQAAFDEFVGQGFRLTWVNGYTVNGEDRYAAIWEQDGGPAFVARHGLTAGEYQESFDEFVGQGFRLTCVSGYTVNGEDRFAAIWQQDGGPAFAARHGLTSQQYQETFDQLVGQGFRLTHVNGYTVNGEDRYAAIWEQDGGPAFVARHGLTAADYQAAFDEFVGQGFRLTCVSGYTVNGEDRFAAIWQQDGGPAFVARHGLTAGEYQESFDQFVGQGFRLRCVDGFGRD